MSSGPRGDSNQTTFSPGTPHFFKIILEENLQENKLRVPQRFVRKYGGTLSNSVFVKLPCGSKWTMQLTKEEDNTWFEKGWPDFVKHYSIKRGSMLTFRYEGNSEFHAVIFDASTVEIDYPSIPVDFDRSDIDLKLQAPIEKVVPKAREKSPSPCCQPHKRIRMSPNGETQRNSFNPISKGSCHGEIVLENSMGKENLHISEPEMTGKHGLPAKNDRDKSTTRSRRIKPILRHTNPPISTGEKVASLQKARDFESRHPFFKVVIYRSYVYGSHLEFSPNFAIRHLKNKSSDATLIVSSGKKRTWSVTYSFKVYGKKKLSASFKSGWSTFARDNNLDVGDTCVFVLLEDIKTAFEVVIFRANENSKSTISPAHENGVINVDPEEIQTNETQPGSSLDSFPGNKASVCMSTPWKTKNLRVSPTQKARILERVPFESNKPFFKILMQPAFMSDILCVPLDFAIRYIKVQADVVLSVPNGRYWSAKFRMNRLASPRARIYNGWNQFVKGNNLEVGDVCIFKLLDGTELSFEVSIVRFDEYECRQWSQAGDYATGASKPMGDVRVKIEID